MRLVAELFGALVASTLALPVFAQGPELPPIKIVVPYPGGGIVDLMARVVSKQLIERFGVTVYVEPRPGANTSIGTEAVARAKPDGGTLLLATPELVVTPHLQDVNWDPTTDFVGVASMGRAYAIVVVHPSVPATDLRSFVAFAKAHPGKVHYLAPGTTSMLTISAELLQLANDFKMVAVPYQGIPPGMPDLMSGRIQFGFIPAPIVKDLVSKGTLNAIAVTGDVRLKNAPSVPTMVEQGYESPSLTIYSSWFIFVAPAKTPRPIVDRLNAAFNDVLKDPAVVAQIEQMGGRVVTGWTPEETTKHFLAEYPRWGEAIRKAGIKPLK